MLKTNHIYFKEIKLKTIKELQKITKNDILTEKNDLFLELFKQNDNIIFEGVLEKIDTYGFLRDGDKNFLEQDYDIYIKHSLIQEYNLRSGDIIECILDVKQNSQKLYAAKKILSVNNQPIQKPFIRSNFEELPSCFPIKQIILENELLSKSYNSICRIIDLICPIGAGQRALIVAPPKTGKTSILHSIAQSIMLKKEYELIILLVGERPEEVTEMKKIVPDAKIFFSTFDQSPEYHIKTCEMVYEYLKRKIENGDEVVLLVDSITRLVRSYNHVVPSSGKVWSGGLDPLAINKARKFFGIGRNTETAGSVTILATVLVDTGSKMDDLIYEEFKGTGNSELKLNKHLSNHRIYPAVSILESGTRRSELMQNNEKKIQLVLNQLRSLSNGTELLISKINNSVSNEILINNAFS